MKKFTARHTKILFLFKQSSLRATALRSGGSSSYLLYGMPELAERGYPVEAAPDRQATGLRRWLTAGLRRLSCGLVGSSGNCGQILGAWPEIRSASALVLTANNVSIPVLFLRWLGFRFPPLFVISVGLETLADGCSGFRRSMLARLYRKAENIVVFSEAEKKVLVSRMGLAPERVAAVPYGIAGAYLPEHATSAGVGADFDILSVGADIHRDLSLLLAWARRHPDVRVHLVLSRTLLDQLGTIPGNVGVECDLSLEAVFDRLKRTKTVVIPVRQNNYTAGTTFLIQALAGGRPTLVAKTRAVETLYELEAAGCLTYRPENSEDFSEKIDQLLRMDAEEVETRSHQGREWVRQVANGKPLLDELENFLRRPAHESGGMP